MASVGLSVITITKKIRSNFDDFFLERWDMSNATAFEILLVKKRKCFVTLS